MNRYLFYFVHPSKFHLFRVTINKLKEEGHHVDIIINSKDVLENLMKQEGWQYTNIFPNGRNVSNKPSLLSSALKFIITIIKLENFLFKNKRYDKFITDDSLVVNGILHRTKSFIFNDNDIITIKINKILFYFADVIISPEATELGNFTYKKKSFKGNKALAHLHPDLFNVNNQVLEKYNLEKNKYCIIRTALLNATHDIGKNIGITDKDLNKLINYLLLKNIKPIIIAERTIQKEHERFIYKGKPIDLPSILFYSLFVITDSGTIATEAAVLGVPNFLINLLAKKVGVHHELKNANLQFFYDKFEEFYEDFTKIDDLILLKTNFENFKIEYFKDKIDINKQFFKIFTTN